MTQDNLVQVEPNLPNPNQKPFLKWWQWMATYSTILAALLGVVPPIVEAYRAVKANVSFGNGGDAFTQERLWRENKDCLMNVQPLNVTTVQGVDMAVRICPSGDVQITRSPYSSESKAWWIDSVAFQKTGFSEGLTGIFISKAIAASLEDNQRSVQISSEQHLAQVIICTKILGEGRLLQRLQYSDGHCVDQIVDTYTGEVISEQQGSCSSNC